jgi:very-short-patch-repair endonuclease
MAWKNKFNEYWSANYYKHCTNQVPRQTALETEVAKLAVPYRIQHPFPGAYAVVDFFIPSLGLILEIDGKEHRRGEKLEKDQIRDAKLAKMGYVTVRLRNEDVDENPEAAFKEALENYHAIVEQEEEI